MKTLLIINPVAHRGRIMKEMPQVTARLKQLGVAFEVQQTEAPNHAIQLARDAAKQGYARVVAVGGDGTCNEVVNGLLLAAQAGHEAMLGVIPLGSGNDLACALRIPTDITGACQILQTGTRRVIDAARVTVDGQSRFFANSIGLGLEAEVTIFSRQVKLLHGFPMYLWSALNVIMRGRWPYQMELGFDGQATQLQMVTLMAIANGVRSGGGFYLTPNAKLDDGLLDVCYGGTRSRLTLLNLLPRALQGKHVTHPVVRLRQVTQIELRVAVGLPAHVDGEVLCTHGREFKFEVLPGALAVWA